MHIDLSKIMSGFSDRLRAITFHIALSKFIKVNNFTIYEKKNIQCPFKFTDFCKIKNKKIKMLNKNIYNNENIIFTSYNSEIDFKNCKKANHYQNKINSKKLLSKWIKSFKDISPNSNLQKKINKINLPKNFVSIHIRSTDRVVKLKNIINDVQLKDMIVDYHMNEFPDHLINFITKYTKCKNIYISSDQEEMKLEIIRILRDNNFNVYFNNNIFNNKSYRKTSGSDFLVDLFSMSKSRYIFTTVGGGVPFTANLLSKKKNEVINWSSEFNKFILFKFLILTIFYLKKSKNFIFKFFNFK